jgi:hypothetical protein
MTDTSTWLAQGSWTIDSVLGDDRNSGSPSSPLKTVAEWADRIGYNEVLDPPVVLDPNGTGVTAPFCDVYIINDLLATDLIAFETKLGPNVILRFWGVGAMTVYSGTIGALTTKAPDSTNTPWSFQDTGSPGWTTIGRGQRLRDTNVARSNVIAWTAKDLGSQTVRTSDWGVRKVAPQTLNSGIPVAPVSGDTYVVEQLRKVQFGRIYVSGDGNNTTNRSFVNFIDLDVTLPAAIDGAPTVASDKLLQWFLFSGCRFSNQSGVHGSLGLYGGNTFFQNCGFANVGGSVYSAGSIMSFLQGVSIGVYLTPAGGGELVYDLDFLQQDTPVTLVPGIDYRIAGLAIFDVGGDAFKIDYQCAGKMMNQFQSVHRLWGAGNTGFGVRVYEGGLLSYVTTVPTISGSLGDFVLGGSGVGWSFDSMSSLWIPSGGLTCSWSNLAAPQGIAGFGGSATNPGQKCGIYKHL